jgi:hypothetical protein
MIQECADLNIDASQLGGSVVYDSAALTFDINNQPSELLIRVVAPDNDDFVKLLNMLGADGLAGQAVSGVLEDGRSFSTQIKAAQQVTQVDPVKRRLVLSYLIDETKIGDPTKKTTIPRKCVFGLTNVKLWLGDERTEIPLPPGLDPKTHRPGWTRNKIRFNVAGREWQLIDEMFSKWTGTQKPDVYRPLLTASLSTAIRDEAEIPELEMLADDVCNLLSLALAHKVSWYSRVVTDDTEQRISERCRAVLIHPFNRGSGSSPINNYDTGAIRKFLETAYPVYSKDPAWWRVTLPLFLEEQMINVLEIKSSLLSILADRTSTKALKGPKLAAQIDPGLDQIADDKNFRSELNVVLSKLSPQWTENRTGELIKTIKMWNAIPSFPNKIRLACEALKIKPPNPALLKPRHKLLHLGELDVTGDPVEFWKEFECLVLLMVLTMLGYTGLFYHYKLGPSPKPIKEFLSA